MNAIKRMFNSLKSKINKVSKEELETRNKVTEGLNLRATEMGQDRLQERISFELNNTRKILEKAIPVGYDKYIDVSDINKYVNFMSKDNKKSIRVVRLISLTDYPRNIPNEAYKKIKEAKKVFDDIYILYTDFTREVEKDMKIEKDPIAFGVFTSEVPRKFGNKSIITGSKYFVVADWIDDYCDLTLNKLIDEYTKYISKDSKIVKDSKEYINSVLGKDNLRDDEYE